ncbi:MAG: hypothetical protein HY696_07645 [Deltaproteobacteria bacterium]|nr:hypothetical protein [Deltaproteobacteria bacterium]
MTTIACYFPMPRPEWAVPESVWTGLQRQFTTVQWCVAAAPQQLRETLAKAQVLFAPLLTAEMLAAAPELQWYHSSSIQFGDFVEDSVFESEVILTNSRGVHAEPVADAVFGALLQLSTGATTTENLALRPEEGPQFYLQGPRYPLAGRTMAIVGLGGNGCAVARRARACGMRVLGIKRQPNVGGCADVEAVYPPSALAEVARQADVLVVTAPKTRETVGLIDATLLRLLPQRAIVINTGRPEILVEAAVLAALDAGHLSGVGVDDVVPRTSPLLRHARVVVTPHMSPACAGCWDRIFALFAAQLRRYLNGEPLHNLMDRNFRY